jgi:murein DD-endopeptidase MepM/ murein hydrolase activator NlpD
VFEVGDSVDQGQKIGVMGNLGISSGPHLDFRIRKDGVYLDPKVFFDRSSVMYGSGGQR